MNTSKKGFSFIEIIICIAIIIIISVVAVTTHSSMVDKSNNSKILSDITTLENSITSYKNETNKFPSPEGNLKYFKEDTSYAHDLAQAFGVSGYVTNKTIPAKYLNYLPLDPKTGQYYALSVTKDELSYEIAGVTKKNETYLSRVNGNWKGEYGPTNLVREYNGPSFVYDESISNFPYNPEELLLNAKISNFSGSVIINGLNYSENETLSMMLVEGDKISVGTGSYAELYFSDGSYSILGDSDLPSEMVLSQMRYKEKTNLFTNIKLALNIGSLWTKASKLGEKSEYEIYTTDTIAAVRGTVFGVRKNGNSSEVSVIEGKVEVRKITGVNSFEVLTQELKEDNLEKIGGESIGYIEGVTDDNGVIEVIYGGSPKGIRITKTASRISVDSGSGTTNKLPESVRDIIENNIGEINSSIKLEILYLKNEDGNKEIKIGLNDVLKNGNIVKINKEGIKGLLPTQNDYLILTGSVLGNANEIDISICKNNNCSSKLSIDFKNSVSYEKDKEIVADNEQVELDQYYNRWCFRSDNGIINELSGAGTQPEKGCYLEGKMHFYKPGEKVKYEHEAYGMGIKECLSSKDVITNEDCKKEECKSGYERVNGVCALITSTQPCTGSNCNNSGSTNPDTYPIKEEELNQTECKDDEIPNLTGTGCILNPNRDFRLVAEANFNDNIDLIDVNNNISLRKEGGFLKSDVCSSSNSDSSLCNLYKIGSSLKRNIFKDDNGVLMNSGSYYIYNFNGTKGVYLDNILNDDYLKYDISSLNLNSGSGFKIEMSVRGGALKRWGGTNKYKLFNLDNNANLNIFNGNNNYLSFYTQSGLYTTIQSTDINSKITNNNKFYKIIVKVEDGIPYLDILDGNTSILSGTLHKTTSPINKNYNMLYIGSDNTYTNQWNDIVDYVKIYKK